MNAGRLQVIPCNFYLGTKEDTHDIHRSFYLFGADQCIFCKFVNTSYRYIFQSHGKFGEMTEQREAEVFKINPCIYTLVNAILSQGENFAFKKNGDGKGEDH